VDLLGQLSNPSDQASEGIPSLGDRVTPAIAASQDEHGRRPRRLTEVQVKALIDAYQLGARVMDLAIEHGIHRVTVMEHLRRSEIPRRSDLLRWTTEQLAEVTELYNQGSSVRTIGAQYGVDPSTVAKRLKRAGVSLRPRRGFT
jgi:transposase-like protein